MQNKKQIIVAGNNVGNFRQVSCPVCGYRMPIFSAALLIARGFMSPARGGAASIALKFPWKMENRKSDFE